MKWIYRLCTHWGGQTHAFIYAYIYKENDGRNKIAWFEYSILLGINSYLSFNFSYLFLMHYFHIFLVYLSINNLHHLCFMSSLYGNFIISKTHTHFNSKSYINIFTKSMYSLFESVHLIIIIYEQMQVIHKESIMLRFLPS